MTITPTDDRPIVLTSSPGESDAPASPGVLVDAPAPASVSGRPTFTITDAAAACAVSRKTITRKLTDLADHGAAKDSDGVWRIPVEALLAVGLHPGRSLSREAPAAPAAGATSQRMPSVAPDPVTDTVTIPRDRWDDLRIRLARAEAEAAERALALADARLALRALTAGPTPTAPSQAATEPDRGNVADSSAQVTAPAHTQLAQSQPTSVESAPSGVVPAQGAGAALGIVPVPIVTAAAEGSAMGSAQELASARTQAAQRGGYVPAAGAAPRKKRWWRSAH